MYQNRIINDYGVLKQYGNHGYKITVFKNYINPDIKDPEVKTHTDKGEAGNEFKLINNLSRTKSRLFELALCNTWDYFVTFTFDKIKFDREDLKTIMKSLTQFFRNFKRFKKNNSPDFKYLLIPEKHQDGISWHLHGFLSGLSIENLTALTLQDHLPYKILDKLKKGDTIYTWQAYTNLFGYCTLSPVRSHEAASKYVMKYITKDLERTVTELNAHMFYASHGLESSKVLEKGIICEALEPEYSGDTNYYENDYVIVKYIKDKEKAKHYFDYGDMKESGYWNLEQESDNEIH